MPKYPQYPRGQIPGTPTNDVALAGNIGELLSTELELAAKVALTSGAVVQLLTVTVTPGDWLVSSKLTFRTGANTTIDSVKVSVHTVTASISNLIRRTSSLSFGGTMVPTLDRDISCGIVAFRWKVAVDTPIYLNAVGYFGADTLHAFGFLEATRIR